MATIQKGQILKDDLNNWDGITRTDSRIDATGGTITGNKIGEAVDVLQVYGGGTNYTSATINNAIAAISANNVAFIYAPGTWNITENITIPSNVANLVPQGTIFNISAGITLTIAGFIFSHSQTISSGTGTLTTTKTVATPTYYEQTPTEKTAGINPSAKEYPPGYFRRFGAAGDGSTDDTTAVLNAELCKPAGGILYGYPGDTYLISSVIPITNPGTIDLQGSAIQASGNINGLSFTQANTTSADRFLHIKNGKLIGDTNQGKGIYVTSNNPFIYITQMQIRGWDVGVDMDGSYDSRLVDCHIHDNNYGVELHNACHASIIENCFIDNNTNYGVTVNRGGGTTRIHDIFLVGGAYQGGAVGVLMENCEDCQLSSPYFEGNTDIDLQLGVADAGTYATPAYNVSIVNMQTASPCSTGSNNQNVVIEHAVGVRFYGIDFKSGSSTATNNVYVDGFSDKIFIEYRGTSAATPFNFSGSASQRVVLSQGGQCLYPSGMATAITFGTSSTEQARIYKTSSGGRDSLRLESESNDLWVTAPDIIYFKDYSSGQILAYFDGLNTINSDRTAMFLTYYNGTAITTQRVTVGAADSGGAGYKLLRVPN